MLSRTGYILTALIALALVIFKIPLLDLPCYWDESFPYSLAVRHQVEQGLSLLPNGMPEHLSTGHPPVFYFLMAAWMKLTGGDMWVARVFPLLISVGVLFALYRLAVRHFTAAAGVAAVALTATYAAFFVQSSFMLPETLLTLWVILALDAWLGRRWIAYIVFGTLAVLTKEPAVMFLLALCVWEVVRWWRESPRSAMGLVRNALLAGLPGLLGASYFLVQKMQMGWFFFPRHVSAAGWDSNRFVRQFFHGYGSQVFVFQGHLAFSLVVVAGVALLAWKNRDALKSRQIAVGAILTFMLFFVAFSAVNFYNSARYILCVYPLWFLLVGWISSAVMQKIQWAHWATIVSLCGLHLFFLITMRGNGDTSPGYACRVRAHQQGAQWLVEHGYAGKPVLAHFLMLWQLTDPAPGYMPSGKTMVKSLHEDPNAIIVLTDHEKDMHGYREMCGTLLARFEDGPAWIEIHERKPAVRE